MVTAELLPLPRTPPVLTVEPGESLGHDGTPGPPESRGDVPDGVSVHRGPSGAYMASSQHRWPKVGEGLATEDGLAGGGRWSRAAPPLSARQCRGQLGGSSCEPHGSQDLARDSSLTLFPLEQEDSPRQAPRNLGLGCAFSDFSVCSCSV